MACNCLPLLSISPPVPAALPEGAASRDRTSIHIPHIPSHLKNILSKFHVRPCPNTVLCTCHHRMNKNTGYTLQFDIKLSGFTAVILRFKVLGYGFRRFQDFGFAIKRQKIHRHLRISKVCKIIHRQTPDLSLDIQHAPELDKDHSVPSDWLTWFCWLSSWLGLLDTGFTPWFLRVEHV